MTRNKHVITGCLLMTWTLVDCASTSTEPSDEPATQSQAPAAAAQPAAAGSGGTAQPAAATPSSTAAKPAATPSAQPAATGQATAAASSSAGAAGQTASTPAATQPSMQPAAAASSASMQMPVASTPSEVDHTKDLRGTCPDLHTQFPDDSACIAAPKPSEGFQIHVGPSSYDDPAEVAKFIIKPGEEKTECYTFRANNEMELTYQAHVLSGRAGTHHIINTIYSGELPTGNFEAGCGVGANPLDENAPKQIGSIPGASKAYMERRSVAPEFADVGRKIPAKALIASDMHYYNFTDKDILREYWINVYYPPAEVEVKRMAQDIVAFGGLGWNLNPIQPGTDMVYKYECPISGDGWIINLLGHYHVHGKRFGVSVKRKSTGMSEKVFEMYDPADPAVFDYNSITMNPPFSDLAAGAISGMLPVSDGDLLQWECHIINDSDVALGYTNEVKTGEMCNTWGFTVGTKPVQCGVP